MQVSVEELDGLERRMTVAVPPEKIEPEVQTRLADLAKSVRLHGFRPGKVPFKVVKRLYGPGVRQEVIGKVLESSYQEALNQVELRPVGKPVIEPVKVKEGENFEYIATFEILPAFELQGIHGLKVERPDAEVTETDIDHMIETLRRQRTVWHDVERAAREGDRLTIDFEGKLDGQDFPHNKADHVTVVLGSGAMISGFEEQLLGLPAGAETEFDISFPEDYQVAGLAGKTARFTVKVHSVAEPELPPVDEGFAAALGVQEGGVPSLRKAIRDNMERELGNAIRSRVRHQLLQGLLDANNILVPRALVEPEVERLAEQSHIPAGDQGGETAASIRTTVLEPAARRGVALGLILSKLAQTYGIELDNDRVRTHLAAMAAAYEHPEEVVDWYKNKPEALEQINSLALEGQVLDWLLARAEVTEIPSTFDAVVKGGAARETSE